MKLKDDMEKWIVCRICLHQPVEALESIFHPNDEKDLKLLIHECGGVPINQFDHYPDKICTKCLQCLKEAYIFRKTCQQSHERLSRLIAAFDVDSAEQNKIAFVEEYSIEELELKFDPKDVKAEIETEMFIDTPNLCDDETEDREIAKFSTIEVSKTSGSTAVDSENQQEISHVEESDCKNLEQRLKLKEEIVENEMTYEVFDAFEKGAEEFIKDNTYVKESDMHYNKLDVKVELEKNQKLYENEMILGQSFEDEQDKLMEIDKTEKAEYLQDLENDPFYNLSDDEYAPHPKKSSSRKIKGKMRKLESYSKRMRIKKQKSFKCSNIQNSANTSDEEFLLNTSIDCEVCGLTFAQNQDLMEHMKIHTNECEICERTFVTYQALEKHHRTHTNERPHSCNTCGRTFARKETLTRHIRTHSSERAYKCSYCPKTFKFSAPLVRHNRTHTNERPSTCDICGKSFSITSNLKRHKIKVHNMVDSDISPESYKCEVCEPTFDHKTHLAIHMKTHSGERLYSCEICDRTFVQKPFLTWHMRNHAGEFPYKCSYCPKTFANPGARRNHYRTHTIESPYTCDICGKSFAINILKNHKIKVHGINHISEKTPMEIEPDC